MHSFLFQQDFQLVTCFVPITNYINGSDKCTGKIDNFITPRASPCTI